MSQKSYQIDRQHEPSVGDRDNLSKRVAMSLLHWIFRGDNEHG